MDGDEFIELIESILISTTAILIIILFFAAKCEADKLHDDERFNNSPPVSCPKK